LYTDKNSDIAPDLVKLLMESKQEIPDFLEEFKPEGALEFRDDDTDAEGEGEDGMGDAKAENDGFGGSVSGEPAQANQGQSGEGWGGADDW
jgi:ATP-dependent RNA helicase DDX3X